MSCNFGDFFLPAPPLSVGASWNFFQGVCPCWCVILVLCFLLLSSGSGVSAGRCRRSSALFAPLRRILNETTTRCAQFVPFKHTCKSFHELAQTLRRCSSQQARLERLEGFPLLTSRVVLKQLQFNQRTASLVVANTGRLIASIFGNPTRTHPAGTVQTHTPSSCRTIFYLTPIIIHRAFYLTESKVHTANRQARGHHPRSPNQLPTSCDFVGKPNSQAFPLFRPGVPWEQGPVTRGHRPSHHDPRVLLSGAEIP